MNLNHSETNMSAPNPAFRMDPTIERSAIELIVTNFAIEHGLTIHHIGLIGSRGRGTFTDKSDYDFAFIYSVNGKSIYPPKEDVTFETTHSFLPNKIEFRGTELKKYLRDIERGSVYQLEWLVSFPIMGPLAKYVSGINDYAYHNYVAGRMVAHVQGLIASVVDRGRSRPNFNADKQLGLALHYMNSIGFLEKQLLERNVFSALTSASMGRGIVKDLHEIKPDFYAPLLAMREEKDYSEERAKAVERAFTSDPFVSELIVNAAEAHESVRSSTSMMTSTFKPWDANMFFDIHGGQSSMAKKLSAYPYL